MVEVPLERSLERSSWSGVSPNLSWVRPVFSGTDPASFPNLAFRLGIGRHVLAGCRDGWVGLGLG